MRHETVSIRRASDDDRPVLLALLHALGYPIAKRDLDMRLSELRFERDHALFVAVREASAVDDRRSHGGHARKASSPFTRAPPASSIARSSLASSSLVCGFAHAECTRGLLSGPRVILHALVVDERQRGRGTGAALLHEVETFAEARGVRDIRVASNVMRERAHRFYERHGYVRTKAQVVLDKTIAVRSTSADTHCDVSLSSTDRASSSNESASSSNDRASSSNDCA